MKNYVIYIALAIIVFANYSFINTENHKKTEINWLSWEDLQEAQAKEPRKVFIDIYTNWCYWCKVMDSETFTNEYIIAYLNKNYYSIKFDAENRNMINFKGKDYKYIADSGKRGVHELAEFLLDGKTIYPSTVFLDENFNVLTSVSRYLGEADLDPLLTYFATETYLDIKWAEYEKSYISILE